MRVRRSRAWIASAFLISSPRGRFMDVEQLVDAIIATNNISTIASILCVLPTYFLRLQPATYRLVLSLGIVFGLSTLAVAMTTVILAVCTLFRSICFPLYLCPFYAVRRRPHRDTCAHQARNPCWPIEHGCSGLRHYRLGRNLCSLLGSRVVTSRP